MTVKSRIITFTILICFFAAAAASAEPIQRTVLRVDKMTCGYCLSQINNKLNSIDGTLGMRASLRRGVVVVDHQVTLEGAEIADAITSLGYPADIIAQSEVDEEEAFSVSSTGTRQYGGCCGGGASAVSGGETDGNYTPAPEQRNAYRGGCTLQGSGRSGGGCCGASASAWKEVYRKYSNDREGTE